MGGGPGRRLWIWLFFLSSHGELYFIFLGFCLQNMIKVSNGGWSLDCKQNSIFTWKRIRLGLDILKYNVCLSIGNGKSFRRPNSPLQLHAYIQDLLKGTSSVSSLSLPGSRWNKMLVMYAYPSWCLWYTYIVSSITEQNWRVAVVLFERWEILS